MMSEAPVMENEAFNHYLAAMSPEFVEHLMDSCPEFGDLNVEELLLVQESAFQYIQKKNQNKDTASSFGETSDSSLVSEPENEISRGASIDHQLALDEALARALELGDDFNHLSFNEDAVTVNEDAVTVNAVDNTRSIPRETPSRAGSQNIVQDDIDPDTMTYEELQSLGESLGSESRGLPADLISRLPTFKYKYNKSGFFSKKKKEKEECVICHDAYKYGTMLTTLPCAHQYHSSCITTWFQQSKQCPVCQKEVQDE